MASKVKPRKPSARKKTAPPKPWEMQEDETVNEFRYFVFYRDMQRRSIMVCSKAFGHANARKMEKISQKCSWQARCRAWDVELDRRVRDCNTKDIADMRKRHINLGLGMQTAVAKELRALVAKIERAAADAKAAGREFHEPVLSVADILRLSQHGTQLERLSRGEHTDHIKTEGAQEDDALKALSVAELKALAAMKQKLKGE